MYTQVVVKFTYINVHTGSDQVHLFISINKQNTVKPAHVVTSIKQSSVLIGYIMSCPVINISYELNLF